MHTFCQVAAVVVCLDEALGVVGVDVKGVEVRADALYGGEILSSTVSICKLRCIRTGLKDIVLT